MSKPHWTLDTDSYHINDFTFPFQPSYVVLCIGLLCWFFCYLFYLIFSTVTSRVILWEMKLQPDLWKLSIGIIIFHFLCCRLYYELINKIFDIYYFSYHVSSLFEKQRFFSHLSTLERELSFRTEMVSVNYNIYLNC